MSEIAIVASGTRGDVQPYVALGKALKAAGYRVRLLGTENFEHLATDAGLAFAATGPNIEAMLQREEWRNTLESSNFLLILSHMQKEMKRQAAVVAERIPALLQGSDLIVTGAGGLGGTFAVGQHLKIPIVQAYVFPFTPTQDFPSPLVPHLPFGRLLNKLSFHVTRQLLWQSTKTSDSMTRARLDYPKARFGGLFDSCPRKTFRFCMDIVTTCYLHQRIGMPHTMSPAIGFWMHLRPGPRLRAL